MRCQCGSGRSFERCHGDPRNEFARVQALAEARELPRAFPFVRPTSAPVLAFAERAAAELAEADDLGDDVLDAGLELAEDGELRRLVEGWADDYPAQWESLVRTAADEEAVLRQVARGALEAAVLERASTPDELFAALERAGLSPAPTLAFVLPPPFVWSYNEARVAVAAGADAVDEVASALMRGPHERRVRELAESLERELPRSGFPSASARLAKACRQARADLQFVRAVLTLLLLAYTHQLELQSYSTSRN